MFTLLLEYEFLNNLLYELTNVHVDNPIIHGNNNNNNNNK